MELPKGPHKAGDGRGWAAMVRSAGGLVLAIALLVALFGLPAALWTADLTQFAAIPLALVLAIAVLALWPNGEGSTGGYARRAAAGVLTALLVFEGLDLAIRAHLGRPFALVFDLPLVMSAAEFVYGTFGALNAILVGSFVLAGVLLAYAVVAICLRAVQGGIRSDRYARISALAVCGMVIAGAIGQESLLGRVEPIRIVSDRSLRDLVSQVRSAVAMLDDYSTFRMAGIGPAVSPAALATGLESVDVLVFWDYPVDVPYREM